MEIFEDPNQGAGLGAADGARLASVFQVLDLWMLWGLLGLGLGAFEVWGLGFGVWGLGFRVWGFGLGAFRV